MDERERMERFNRDLERVMRGALPPEQPGGSQDDQEELDIARRLVEANFSRESSQQTGLERRLVEQISASKRRARWQTIGTSVNSLAGSAAWVAILVALVVVLSWALRAFQPQPAGEQATLPAVALATPSSRPTSQTVVKATQPPAWSVHATATEPSRQAVTQPAASVNPAATKGPSPTEAQPPIPVGTAEPSPLTRYSTSDEVRERLAESWHLWKTVWVDAQVTTTQRGRSAVEREQLWYQQPSQGIWMAGTVNGAPNILRVRAAGKTVETTTDTRTPRDLGNIRLIPSMLDKVLFPNWSFATREGEFKVVGESILAGRIVVVAEFSNTEGVKSDRFWIDSTSGIILRWLQIPTYYAGADEQAQFFEIEITSIVIDADFPLGIMDPAAALPDRFSPGFWTFGEQK